MYNTYAPRDFNFSKKFIQNTEDCDEIVQITFEALWKNREKVDENRPVSTYILTIAKNWIVNTLKKGLHKKTFLDYTPHPYANHPFETIDSTIEFNELNNVLEEVMDQLPNRRKRIYKMRYNDGYTYKEIANILSITESTVNSQMTKAIDFI